MFAKKWEALNVWLKMFDAKTDFNSTGHEDLYLLKTGTVYHS